MSTLARLRALAPALLCLVAACSDPTPKELNDEAAKALNSGDYKGALASSEKAIKAVGSETADPQYLRAHLGAVEARCFLDAPRAGADFLELAKANPKTIGDREYSMVASRLAQAKRFDAAIDVLKAGKSAFPDSVALKQAVQTAGEMAAKANDTAALDALKGLGYIG